jgi:hypothetical protein
MTSQKITASLEIISYLSVIAVIEEMIALGIISINTCAWIVAALLISLTILSYYRFDGGRHPCFLFLVTILLFQGGRLVCSLCGIIDDPMLIVVQTSVPISVKISTAELTLILLAISAGLIYAPCRLFYKPVKFSQSSDALQLRAIYVFIALTIPFSFYKNIMYFLYLKSHGGYITIYTDNAAVLQSAGIIPRVVSMVNIIAIMVAYVLEYRPKRSRFILFLYLIFSVLNLLIGFRGKFFTQIMTLWYIHNLKTGHKFRFAKLFVFAALGCLISVIISIFRGDAVTPTFNPLEFIGHMGVSINVTEAAIEFYDLFSQYRFNYILGGFTNGITPLPVGAEHVLWTNDLSYFLNSAAARLGFGSASSYLAELYLLGRSVGIILGSLAIGGSLNIIHHCSSRLSGTLLLAFILPDLIYLPRLELLAPLSALIKSFVGVGILAIFVVCYKNAVYIFHFALKGVYQDASKS